MSFPSWPSPLRLGSVVACLTVFAATSSYAQSSRSADTTPVTDSRSDSAQPDTSQPTPGESSSSSYLPADLSTDPDGAGALRAATGSLAAEGGAGHGAGGQEYGGRRGSLFNSLAFEVGGGGNGPLGNSSDYITWGGQFTLGGGLHLSHGVSVLAEYQFLGDKLPGNLIAETGADGGNAHIWSLTLAPVIDLMPKKTNSLYITGGGGFYRKVTNFTDPQEAEYCDYFYCSVVTENVVVGHFSSNQGGWNVGGGFTHKVGGAMSDGRMKLFAEARYLYVDTPAVQGSPNGLGTTAIAAGTKVLPFSFGVRF